MAGPDSAGPSSCPPQLDATEELRPPPSHLPVAVILAALLTGGCRCVELLVWSRLSRVSHFEVVAVGLLGTNPLSSHWFAEPGGHVRRLRKHAWPKAKGLAVLGPQQAAQQPGDLVGNGGRGMVSETLVQGQASGT